MTNSPQKPSDEFPSDSLVEILALEAENLRMRDALSKLTLCEDCKAHVPNPPYFKVGTLPDTERFAKRLECLDLVRRLLEKAVSVEEDGEGCKSKNVAQALAELKALERET